NHLGICTNPAVSCLQEVGVSTEPLARIESTMQGYVDRGAISGTVALILRDGRILRVDTVGFADWETRSPMHSNTIFHIASMTKPVTSVAAMILYEEGELALGDAVSKYIPAFAGRLRKNWAGRCLLRRAGYCSRRFSGTPAASLTMACRGRRAVHDSWSSDSGARSAPLNLARC